MEKEEFVGEKVNQKTSSLVSLSAIENVFKSYISKNRPELKYIGVSKENGIKKQINGQEVYVIEYELIIESIADIYINEKPSIYHGKAFLTDFNYDLKQNNSTDVAFGLSKSLKLIKKGGRFLFQGTLPFEITDNGWRAMEFTNKNFKIVSSNYLTPDMAKRLAEEYAKLVAELKKKLDWKKEDIAPSQFNPHYFRVDNVPIFSHGNVKYKIEPISSYQGRNDVVSSIQNIFYQAIESTNRKQKSNELSYNSSQNQGLYGFKILKVDFPFVDAGYQCNISIKGEISGAYNNPENFSFDYTISLSTKSNKYKKNLSKNQAFLSALENLRAKVRSFIFQYEPITIEFIRIETNKRRKVKRIILKKPSPFLNIRKMTFIIMKPSDLDFKNNKFTLTGKIGDCVFNGEMKENEITCNIKGRKNKKAFTKILDSKEKYIALSTF